MSYSLFFNSTTTYRHLPSIKRNDDDHYKQQQQSPLFQSSDEKMPKIEHKQQKQHQLFSNSSSVPATTMEENSSITSTSTTSASLAYGAGGPPPLRIINEMIQPAQPIKTSSATIQHLNNTTSNREPLLYNNTNIKALRGESVRPIISSSSDLSSVTTSSQHGGERLCAICSDRSTGRHYKV